MTKGITSSCKKHVFAFSKEEATRRLWLSAINRDADSFNPENSVVCELHFKAEDFEGIALHVLALLEYECVWNPKLYILFLWNICLNLFLGRKGLTDL